MSVIDGLACLQGDHQWSGIRTVQQCSKCGAQHNPYDNDTKVWLPPQHWNETWRAEESP